MSSRHTYVEGATFTSGNLNVNVAAGGGAGGTSSTFGAAFPGTGTAIGLSNGTNMVPALADSNGYLEVNVKAGGSSPVQPSTSTLTSVVASGSSQMVLASNSSRLGAIITYVDTAGTILYIKYGATASATSFTVPLFPGGVHVVPSPVYTGEIDVISSGSPSGHVYVTELTP